MAMNTQQDAINSNRLQRHLPLPILSAARFAWQDRKLGIADASDLSGKPFFASRVWPDSADVGFVCWSPRTGRRIIFLLDQEEFSPEGGTVLWTFCDAEDLGLTIVIFND